MADLIEKLNSDFPLTEKTDYQMVDVKSNSYSKAIPAIILSLNKYSKICIISTSRQGEKILNELNNPKGILVLTGIKSLQNPQVKEFSQLSIDSLKEAISFAVKEFNPEVFVFDSVTSLSLFLSLQETGNFFQKFIEILKKKEIKGIFINISDETEEETAVRIEALMDQRIPIEKFLGTTTKTMPRKTELKPREAKQEKQEEIIQPTKKQETDIKEMKKTLSQLIKEEARRIAEETRKSLETKPKEQKTRKPAEPKQQKKPVYKMQKEKERQSLMKKMDLLQKSFELGVISKQAFEEGKNQINQKLKGK